jgi:hypothetical protein
MMKKRLIYLLIPMLALALLFSFTVACGEGANTAKKVEGTTAGSEATIGTTATETTLQQVYNIGDSVDLNGKVVTVVSFKKSNGGDYDKPKEGMEYVIVSLKIKNNGTDKITYNPYDFEMQNSKGQITSMALTTVDTKTALSSGELASGGEVEGTVTFEEPKDDSGLVLIYQANILDEDEVIKFNIK